MYGGRNMRPGMAVTDLVVDPAVVGARVRVDRVDVVGELELEVQHEARVHDRSVDALLVHERQAQVAVAPRLLLRRELGHQRFALLGVETAIRIEPVQEHARRARAAVARLGLR